MEGLRPSEDGALVEVAFRCEAAPARPTFRALEAPPMAALKLLLLLIYEE
jgi:hypothetical protein